MHITRSQDVAAIETGGREIGGVQTQGEVDFKLLRSGEKVQLVETKMKAGFFHPNHLHPENESIGYLVSGRLEMVIGGETYIIEPGTCWHHPTGVVHSTRALVDSHAIEVHSPLRADLAR
ncbi:cupin domain-containing protein [Pelagibacterium sediminicola]|uniref:cupin domain-containing protein n=1 Tax=Pelagibacterium sediminicola TaxID=2248761 RepID=UPI0013004C98|nr:cupin domain-containing protein [Pelagibacterium sediminicola]